MSDRADLAASSGPDIEATTNGAPKRGEAETDDGDPAAARVQQLQSQNRRLRRQYARARQAQYRRTGTGLALVGLVALLGAWLFPHVRTVLLALGGTGLFAAVLTWTLTPEQFVAASVSERIHEAHVATLSDLAAQLALQSERVYVPSAATPARLFVPQRAEFDLPTEVDRVLVVPEDETERGISVYPTGVPLYEEFRTTVGDEVEPRPGPMATQLADAVVETFELAAAASVSADRDDETVAVRVEEPLFGDLSAIDHPVVSLLGTGLAARFGRPVTADVEPIQEADGATVTLRFLDDEDAGGPE